MARTQTAELECAECPFERHREDYQSRTSEAALRSLYCHIRASQFYCNIIWDVCPVLGTAVQFLSQRK